MKKYDSSWDEDKKKSMDKIHKKWEKRNWISWLTDHLSFPFKATRVEDNYYFSLEYDKSKPFSLNHEFIVEGLEQEDDLYGIIMKTKEGRRKGHVPLCDMEVTSKDNINYWPVREYVVWFANR